MTVTVLELTSALFFIQFPRESEIRIDREPYLAKVQAFHHLSLWELELGWRSEWYCCSELYFRKNALLPYITLTTSYRLIKLGQPGFISLVFTTSWFDFTFSETGDKIDWLTGMCEILCALLFLLLCECDTFDQLCECDTFDHVLHRINCIIPQAVTHNLVLLKMGKMIARNMLSWLELLINRYCCL